LIEVDVKKHKLLFENLELGKDGIWSSYLPVSEQEEEQRFREKLAAIKVDNYLDSVSKHHSIPVMDNKILRFIEFMPVDSIILDVGGCWGWHWRNINNLRPDIGIIIIDFVRSNLSHAKNVLGSLIGEQIELVHADATDLPFSDEVVDGVWTVQTLQHIPSYLKAYNESYRVLKKKGRLINYSLHINPIIGLIYFLLRKHYHKKGEVDNSYYLIRANNKQKQELENVFSDKVDDKYCECLFHPDLRLTFTGKEGSYIGKFDYYLGRFSVISRLLARQRCFEVVKH